MAGRRFALRMRDAWAMRHRHQASLALIVGLAALIGPSVDWTSEFSRQEIRWRTLIIGLTDVGESRRCEKCCDRPVEAYAFYGLRLQRPVAAAACKEPNDWTDRRRVHAVAGGTPLVALDRSASVHLQAGILASLCCVVIQKQTDGASIAVRHSFLAVYAAGFPFCEPPPLAEKGRVWVVRERLYPSSSRSLRQSDL